MKRFIRLADLYRLAWESQSYSTRDRDVVEMRSRTPTLFRLLILTVGIVLIMGCTSGKGAGPDRLVHQADPRAVQEITAGRRDVASAAWWGFDAQDSTASLQAAIRSGARKLVVPNMSKPWIVRPLLLESNQEIVFEDGAILMARQGAFLGKGDSLLTARDKENITLNGPGASLIMHKQDYQKPPYEKAEWRNCLSLLGCRNIKIEGLRLAASGGDGIYIGRGTAGRIHCQDITIKNVTCEDHHRQGISVIAAENLLIEGCALRGTQGTAPQAGIDFEPNRPDEHLANCVVRDCVIEGNAGYGVLLALSALRAESDPISIVIERCQVRDNRQGALAILGARQSGNLRGSVRLEGSTLVGKQKLDQWPRLEIQFADTAESLNDMVVTRHFRQRLTSDLIAVRETIKNVVGKEELERELAGIEKMIATVEPPPSKEFRAILPFNDLHRRIFAVQAAAWRANGAKPLVVWQKNPWDMLSPTEPPLPGGARVDVVMMKNEWRSAALNISNSGTSATTVRLSIVGLPGGRNPKFVSVRDVPFTDTKSGVPVAAALPEAKSDGSDYLFQIESGMTRQVWLTFNSKEVPAGEYEGQIVGEPGAIRVPVRLKVCAIALPDQLTLHLGGWDYSDAPKARDVTDRNRPALLRYLQGSFVDTPWATGAVMPSGKYDKDGSMTEPPETKDFQKWVERWPNARNYFVFNNVNESFAGLEMGTPPFKKAVAAWITWWVGQVAQWNIKPEQLGLLLVDEPNKPERDKVIVEYGKVIREAQPRVVVFEDPIWTDPQKANPEMFAVSTTLCPTMPMWISQGKSFADFYLKQRDAGKELWFYSCSGPGRLLDPYAYHRMQQWFCWKYGAKGSCFWAFSDSGGASSWNEYASKGGAYTPMFLDATTVTHGKHMEAIREGMEDYEYLRMLRDRVVDLRKKGAQDAAVAAADALLASSADRVTACMKRASDIKWKEPKDRSIADQVRVEILNALLALEGLR